MNKSQPKSSKTENLASSATLNLTSGPALSYPAWLDALIDHTANVETLAGLLEGCRPNQYEPVEPELVTGAGRLIRRELEIIHELLDAHPKFIEQPGGKPFKRAAKPSGRNRANRGRPA